MANIVFNVAGKIFLNFSPMTVSLIRSTDNTKPVSLNYSSGTGQTMTSGQVLYITGTAGQPGYLEVKVNTATTLTGTGSVPLTVYSHPTSTQINQTIPMTFDQSPITLNLTYNSIPTTSDIDLNIVNRGEYNFQVSDFTTHFNDFDGDTLIEVMANGIMTGYEYDVNGTNNYVPYVAGTWIPINQVTRLRFKAADQNVAYVQTNPWQGKDSQGNISV
jgi:hypothetical protein